MNACGAVGGEAKSVDEAMAAARQQVSPGSLVELRGKADFSPGIFWYSGTDVAGDEFLDLNAPVKSIGNIRVLGRFVA